MGRGSCSDTERTDTWLAWDSRRPSAAMGPGKDTGVISGWFLFCPLQLSCLLCFLVRSLDTCPMGLDSEEAIVARTLLVEKKEAYEKVRENLVFKTIKFSKAKVQLQRRARCQYIFIPSPRLIASLFFSFLGNFQRLRAAFVLCMTCISFFLVQTGTFLGCIYRRTGRH